MSTRQRTVRQLFVNTPLALGALLLLAWPASGASITFDATGTDTGFNATTLTGPGIDFWGVGFTSGAGFVRSVSYDLTVAPSIYFDFDGSAGGATEPIFGALVGLLPSDISHTQTALVSGPGTPAILTLTFAPGTFGLGDSLRFAVDTDGWMLTTPLDPGGEFGTVAMPVSVLMYDCALGNSVFTHVESTQAIATVATRPAPCGQVPEPSTLALASLFGLCIISRVLSRRKT